jgi:hypothetical protein
LKEFNSLNVDIDIIYRIYEHTSASDEFISYDEADTFIAE